MRILSILTLCAVLCVGCKTKPVTHTITIELPPVEYAP